MVGVAQLVEHFFVEEVVAGSSPVAHPAYFKNKKIAFAVVFWYN